VTNLDLDLTQLSKPARIEVVKRVQAAEAESRRIWFCSVGRKCDGRPHEGADYPHAQWYQWPPAGYSWDVWFMMCGRGTGKTLSGSNWVRAIASTGKIGRIALIGRTLDDARKTMVEGESGLINACESAGETFDWKPALKTFTFANGVQAFCYTAEEPDKLRGPEHGAGWLDEPCHMDFIEDVWMNYNMGLRQKGYPGGAKTMLTSSPLPTKWTKERKAEDGTRMTTVATSVNIHNLDESYIRRVVDPLRGTRKGRQELNAELLEDVEGALWTSDLFHYFDPATRSFDRIVVGVDPAGSQGKHSDETGIIVCGVLDGALYVLDDFTGKYSPAGWAAKAIMAYELYSADAIVVERNYGGDMVKDTLRNHGFTGRVIEAKASDGKRLRAEPIAALYEQGLGHHARSDKLMVPDAKTGLMKNKLSDLEDELVTWCPA
jgi:phage terminase large subunit-like protein